jgi:hypothetical protein
MAQIRSPRSAPAQTNFAPGQPLTAAELNDFVTQSIVVGANSSMGAGTVNATGLYVGGVAITPGGTGVDTVTAGITATPGATQGTGLLTSQFNEVTTCGVGAGVTLPAYMNTPGQKCRVASYGANQLLVFPQAGQTFFSAGVSNGLNAALTIQVGTVAEFETATATTVYTVP